MNDLNRVTEDLSHVREALRRSEDRVGPPSVYLLWAAISFVGMSLFDHDPHVAGMFWAFAGPLGGILSGWLGWRWSRRLGQESSEEGRRHTLHWTAMMVAILATVPLATTGAIPHPVLGRVILLIIALSYFMAGIYLDRNELWLGLIVLGCYFGMFFVRQYAWTMTGAVLGLSLLYLAWREGRRGARAA
ncbi:MAG: hypothetical protein MUE47_04505 [Acidobacteria bacterium]|jgi:MFS family permease|nr:hypothetical protein [Acidobacteriota bacterium]